jgi:hypothetical protein
VLANFAIYILACVALLRFAKGGADRLTAAFALIYCVVVCAFTGADTLKLGAITLVGTTALFVVMAIVRALGRVRRQPA